MRELTPEEEAQLEEMSNGANEFRVKFTQDDAFQRKILAMLMTDPKATVAFAWIAPDIFANEIHVLIFDIIQKYHKEYQALPDKFVIDQELIKVLADRSPEIILEYRAELLALAEYYVPNIQTVEYIMKTLRRFVREQGFKMSFGRLHEQLKSGEIDIDKCSMAMISQLEELKKITETDDVMMSFGEIEDTQEKEEWLIQNWLEFGSLGMLSGDPFSGKSHIMAEIFASILKHGFFARYQVPTCPILLFDAENKKRILTKRILNALGGGDRGALDKLFFRVDPTRITLPLEIESGVETVRTMIQNIKQRTGHDKVFVVIDTLRSVFAADEMENEDIKKLLYPLQRVAQQETAAILILHHRPKSGASYSGQTSIAGALDYLWMWTSDVEMGVGKLSMTGTRGDHEKPMTFTLVNGRNQWCPQPAEESGTDADHFQEIVLEVLPWGSQCQSDLLQKVKDRWPNDKPMGEKAMILQLTKLVEGGLISVSQGLKNAKVFSMSLPNSNIL